MAANCPVCIGEGGGVAKAIEMGRGLIVILADTDFVLSALAVATMVTVPAAGTEVGA